MKKILSILLLSSIWLSSFGQVADVTVTNPVPAGGVNVNKQSSRYANLTAYRSLYLPKWTSFDLRGGKDSASAVMYNTTLGRMGVYRGSSSWDTVAYFRDLVNYTKIPDGLQSVGDITVAGLNVTVVAPVKWRINSVDYQKLSNTVIAITPATADYNRIDLIYATTAGTILKLQGTETLGVAVEPTLPANTIRVAPVYINGSTVTPPDPDLSSYATIGYVDGNFVKFNPSAPQNGDINVNGDLTITRFFTTPQGGLNSSFSSGEFLKLGRVETFNYDNQSQLAGFKFHPTVQGTETPLSKGQLRFVPSDGFYAGLESEGYEFKKLLVTGDNASLSSLKISTTPTTDATPANILTWDATTKEVKKVAYAPVSVDSISQMQSYTGASTTLLVNEEYRGGRFVLKNETLTDDYGIIFPATGKGAGYHWVRQYTGAYINVTWFPDILPDGITDCADGINAIPSIYTYRYFPAGQYLLNSTIDISGDISFWSFMGDDTPMKTENKGTVFLANFSGNVFDTGTSYSYEGIQFKNFQIWYVDGGYGIRSGWPETRIENVRMLLEYGNGINIAYVSGSNGAFDCTLSDVKIEGRFTDTPVTYSGTGLYIDKGCNNLLFTNSFLYGFYNAIIIDGSENVNIIQNNINASGGDYAIKVLDEAGTTNLNIKDNYIESQNRALYVGQANGVHVINNQISDANFGGTDNLSDAHIYFDDNVSSISVIGNTVTSTFQNQSFVRANKDITITDNHWKRNRIGSTFLGTNFNIPNGSWQRDILETITSGTTTEEVRMYSTNSSFVLKTPPDTHSYVLSDPNGLLRWLIRTTGNESGSNTGSNFSISGRNDAGGGIAEWLNINRANGLMSVSSLRSANNDGTPTAVVRNGDIPQNVAPSSALTLALTNNTNYTFNGTTSVWTLPTIASGKLGDRIFIMNMGSGMVTVNSNSGGNDIYNSGTATNTLGVNVGEIAVFYNNGISFFRQL